MSLFPGLPNLPAGFPDLFAGVTALVEDAIGALSGAAQPLWGIFSNGIPVVIADNVVTLEFKQDFRISNYPVEQGAFASYNKVQIPFEVRIRFSTGGSDAERAAFINSIAAVISDTNLYDVVTPEVAYSNLNFTHQDYRRTATEGAGLMSIDVWCEEVRPASLATSSISADGVTPISGGAASGGSGTGTGTISIRPVSPSASPQVNDGTVQPQAPSAAQQSQFQSDFAEFGL